MNEEMQPMEVDVNPVQIQKFLKGMDYPATKEEILEKARENEADENVMDSLEKLPEREYDGPNAVSEEITGMKGQEDES